MQKLHTELANHPGDRYITQYTHPRSNVYINASRISCVVASKQERSQAAKSNVYMYLHFGAIIILCVSTMTINQKIYLVVIVTMYYAQLYGCYKQNLCTYFKNIDKNSAEQVDH